MTRVERYRLAAVLAGALLIGVGACRGNRSDGFALKGPRDGDSTDIVELESGPDTGASPTLRNMSGYTVITARKTPALPKRIENMSNLELDIYFASLAYKPGGYNSHSLNATCVHGLSGLACTGAESAHVFIQPEAGMNKREITDIPANGLIVARIINDSPGDLNEQVFGYPAHRKTWWVVDSTGDSLQTRFFVRTYSTPAVVFLKHPWHFNHCPHPDAPAGRAARAKFWTCLESRADSTYAMRRHRSGERAAATLESYIHPVSLRSSVPLPLAPPPPTYLLQSNWVSCGGGCCATM